MEKGRRTQYLVTLAVALCSLTAGVALNWSTPVIPKFHDHSAGINITTKEISWVAAIGFTGYMTGSLLTRFTSDVFGRRATILGSALPILIGTIIILNSTTAWMIYVTRFSWGIGTGMLGTVSGIYLAEISDKEIRGTLSAANRIMLNFGSFLVMSIGPFVSFQALSYMLLVLPACYFVACWFIPESPYYYLKERKVDCARKALMTLTGNGDEKVLEDRLSEMRSHVRKEMLRSGSLKELFTGKQYRKAMIIVIGLKVTQLMAGSVAIQQYLGRIIQESSNDISVSTALIVYSAIRFIVGIFYLALVDRCRRRSLLFCTYLISSIILGVVGVCFFIDLSSLSYFSIIPFVGILLNAITSVMGYGPLGYLIPTEIFPINVKSVAMTTVNIFSGFLNFVSVKGYQEVKDLAGLSGVFWFYGSFAFAGAVFSYFVVPETKGKSLREIQIDLQGNMLDEAGEILNPVVNLDVPETKEKSVKESQIDLQENMLDEGDEKLNEVVHLNNGASIQLKEIELKNTST